MLSVARGFKVAVVNSLTSLYSVGILLYVDGIWSSSCWALFFDEAVVQWESQIKDFTLTENSFLRHKYIDEDFY